MTDSGFDAAARLVAHADALLVCAGAGMGVDSGLPDFRGDAGFWRAYPPYERLGVRFTEMADPEHFTADPEFAWGFYGHRLAMYRDTAPHDGFRMVREWGERTPGGARVFTSNVDGHFQRAGLTGVAEAHGSIHQLQCVHGCGDDIWPAEGVAVDVDTDTMRARPPLPGCPHCAATARPNILMFGDAGWIPHRGDDQLQELTSWRRQWPKPVVVELGAGKAVPTVRRYAETASAPTGGLIRINPREPEIRDGNGVSLAYGAREALTEIDKRLR